MKRKSSSNPTQGYWTIYDIDEARETTLFKETKKEIYFSCRESCYDSPATFLENHRGWIRGGYEIKRGMGVTAGKNSPTAFFGIESKSEDRELIFENLINNERKDFL